MVYIIRHGQTRQNREKRLQGRSDLPLDETGTAQARALGERFRSRGIVFDRVISSPLRRAVQTARLAAGEDAPLVTDERLIEMDYGPYEGMDLRHPAPEVLTFFSDFVHNSAPPGMEPLPEIVRRLGELLEELAEESGKRIILLSTHAIAMKGALEYLDPSSQGAWWSRPIGNCAVFMTERTQGKYSAATAPDWLQ
jgi:broad specificity phosphatase PhoE